MKSEIAVYQADGKEIQLSADVVRAYLVNGDAGKISDKEIEMFIRLCQYQGLNPFTREAYLIKYGTSPATIITGKYVFTKRAASHIDCAGWNSGVITQFEGGPLEFRQGTVYPKGETLIGGWCDVSRHSWKVAMRKTVSLSEYAKDLGNWKKMPGTMIEKVAVVAALREAFPDALGGLYDADEMPVDPAKLPTDHVMAVPVSQQDAAGAPSKKLTPPKDEIPVVDVEAKEKVQLLNDLKKMIGTDKDKILTFTVQVQKHGAKGPSDAEWLKLSIENCMTVYNFLAQLWEPVQKDATTAE